MRKIFKVHLWKVLKLKAERLLSLAKFRSVTQFGTVSCDHYQSSFIGCQIRRPVFSLTGQWNESESLTNLMPDCEDTRLAEYRPRQVRQIFSGFHYPKASAKESLN